MLLLYVVHEKSTSTHLTQILPSRKCSEPYAIPCRRQLRWTWFYKVLFLNVVTWRGRPVQRTGTNDQKIKLIIALSAWAIMVTLLRTRQMIIFLNAKLANLEKTRDSILAGIRYMTEKSKWSVQKWFNDIWTKNCHIKLVADKMPDDSVCCTSLHLL